MLKEEIGKQAIKWGAIILVVVIIIYFIKTRMDASKVSDQVEEKKDIATKTQQVQLLVRNLNKNKLSFPEQSYITFSKAIEGSFSFFAGIGGGDGQTIKRIFDGFKTSDDIKMLILKYGIRNGYTLPDAIAHYLPVHSLGFSKTDLNDMLAKKKIAFLF